MIKTFADEVTASVPRLTSFARRLAGNRHQADDLVQETVLRALLHADQFQPGTNLMGWLSVILRNSYFNEKRVSRRFTSIEAFDVLSKGSAHGPQEATVQLNEVNSRLHNLPIAQREALMLVAVNGYSYESAAKIAGCAIGTMKSRVSRARTELSTAIEQADISIAKRFDRDFAHLARAA
jgi:RNA polymerase sigma-70 factor, ECF subfamily